MNKYNDEFLPYIVKWGRRINLYAAAVSFLPILVVMYVFGVRAPIDAIIVAVSSAVGVNFVMWFSDLLAYAPVLGIPGTYMAFLSGNYGNLKVPVATIAQDSVGAKIGTEKASIVSVIAMAVSSIECIIFLGITIALGAGILSQLPRTVVQNLSLMIPALHSALFMRVTNGQTRIRIISLGITIVFFIILKLGWLSFLPGNPTYVVIFASVFGTIFIARSLAIKEEAAETAAGSKTDD